LSCSPLRRPPCPPLSPYTRSSDLVDHPSYPTNPSSMGSDRSAPYLTSNTIGSATDTATGLPRLYAGLNSISSITSCAMRSRSPRSEEHTSELQSRENLVCRLLLEK